MSDYDVILTVGIDKNDAIKQVADAMGIAQKTADENAITYKFSADKKQFLSELHNMLAKTPDLTKHINIEFDDSSFKKGMDDLEKYAGKTANQIMRSINKEFKNYSGEFSDKMVRNLLGASAKGQIPNELYRKKAGEIAVELNKYIGSDGALDLSKVANYKELEHVISLAKDLNVILNNAKGKDVFSDKSAASMLGKQVEAVKKGYSQAISKFGDSYKQQLTNIKTNTETEFAAIFQMLIAGLTNAGEMGSELFKELGEEFKASVQGAGEAMADEIGEGVAASKEHLKELEKQLDDIKKKRAKLSEPVSDKDTRNLYTDVERASAEFWNSGKSVEKSKAYVAAIKKLTESLLHPEQDEKWKELVSDYETGAIYRGGKLIDSESNFAKGTYIPISEMKTRANLQVEARQEEERLEQEIANEKKLLEEANKARTGKGIGGGGDTGTGTGGNGGTGTGGSGTGTGTGTGAATDTVTNVDIEQALENIQTLKQELDTIPETKTINIKINTENTNKIQDVMTGWNEAGNKLYDLRKSQNERFALFNKNNGYLSNPYISDAAGEISAEIIEAAVQEAKGQADSMIHTHGDYGVAALSPEDISLAITALNDGITKQYVMGLNEVSMLDLSSVSEENMTKIETEFKKKVEQIQNDAVKSLEAVGQNNTLGIAALEGSDEFQNKIKEALKSVISSVGINPDDIYKTMSVSDFTNSLKTDKLPTFDIDLKAKLSSDFSIQVQEQLDGISPKPVIKIDAELNDEGISKVNEQLKEIRNNFEGINSPTTPIITETEESIVEEELLDQESIQRALTLQNSTLAEKLSYLKSIKNYSHFMEDAGERKMKMEDLAYDVGGNNPKSEAESQKKIQQYETLCEEIDKADQALDEFGQDYDRIIIHKKNGQDIEIFSAGDLDNIRLAKNEIKDIEVLLDASFLDNYMNGGIPEEYIERYEAIINSYREGKTFAENAVKAMKALDQEIENGTQAANTAEQTSEGLKKEGKSFSEIVEEAAKATEAKKNFAEANKEVLNSIIQSLNGLNSEGEGFNNLNKLINNLANNKDDRIVNLVKNLTTLKDILSSSVDGNSFIKALENIAGQGDNLQAMADILKESQQKIKEAAKSMAQPKEDTVKSFVQNSDLSRYLSDAQKVIADNPIKLAAKLDEAAFKREIERIAPSIAEDFNKQYGTAITGSDVVKVFQEIQNEEKKAYEAAQREAQKAEEAERKRIARVQAENEKANKAEIDALIKKYDARDKANQKVVKDLNKEYDSQEKAEQKAKEAEINDLLNKRKQAYKEIWEINKQLVDPNKKEGELSALKDQKNQHRQDFIDATKNLKALDETAIKEEHINQLYKIRRDAINDINQVNARREDNQKDAELAERSQKEYEKLANAVNKYVEAKTRIASGNALKNDVENANKLENEILEIQDRLASGELYDLHLEEKALKPLDTLTDKLDTLSQKRSSLNLDKDIEINNLIKYEDELEKLGLITPEVREELEKLYSDIANADISTGLGNYRKNLILFKQKMEEPVKTKKDDNVSVEKNINSIISKQEDAYNKVWEIKKKIATLDPNKDAPLIASLRSQEQVYYGIYNKRTEELKLLDEEVAKEQKLTNIAEIRRKAEEDINNIKASQVGDDVQRQVNGAITKYAELTRLQKQLISNQRNPYITDADNEGLKNRISALQEQIKAVRQLTDADGNLLLSAEQLKALDDALAKSELEVSQARIKDAAAAKKQADAGKQEQQVLERTRTSLLQQATQLANNGKLMRAYGDEVRKFIKELSDTSTSKKRLEEIRLELMRIKSDANITGNTGKTFMDTLKSRFTSLGAYLSTFASFYRIVGYIRQAITTIKDLDTELIDLRKTTTMTTSELNQFYLEANNIAIKMGVTTKEIITQAAAWSRLGYSTKEASAQMAELSSQFASISPGVSVENATDYLVSAMKAFGKTTEEVERSIMDNINSIGNTMATTNGEIGEMLERSSAAMAAANNTIEQTIALESAAVEITRNAETTGTAFRTISMRIRGKQSLPPYGENHMLCA